MYVDTLPQEYRLQNKDCLVLNCLVKGLVTSKNSGLISHPVYIFCLVDTDYPHLDQLIGIGSELSGS